MDVILFEMSIWAYSSMLIFNGFVCREYRIGAMKI